MNYKSIACAIATVAIVALSKPIQAATLLPYLEPVREEINNQLDLADSGTPAGRKLVNSLKAAVKLLDKPGMATLANDTRLLSTLAPALMKTSVSNAFLPLLQTAKDNYLAALYDAANSSSNRLNGALPSKTLTAANKALDGIFALLDQASTDSDLKASTKVLAKVPAKLTAADRLVTRALAVTVSPSTGGAGVTAKISGAVNYNFKSRKTVAQVTTIVQNTSASGLMITAGTGSSQTAYAIGISISDLQAGDNAITLSGVTYGDAYVIFAKGTSTGSGTGFVSTSGTIHVNYNPSARTVKGTFSASCVNNDDESKQIDMTGSFDVRLP